MSPLDTYDLELAWGFYFLQTDLVATHSCATLMTEIIAESFKLFDITGKDIILSRLSETVIKTTIETRTLGDGG